MSKLAEVALLFLKLGCVAFGGPAAHIAMMEDEVVTKRKWMTREHFLDLVGATNLIPGPNSTEMAIHCGFHRAGWAGLVAAGVCFILPAVMMTGVLAYGYVTYGHVPAWEPVFYGIRPAVIAIMLGAVMKLGKKALKGWELGVIGGVVMIGALTGLSEIFAILGGGVAGMIWLNIKRALPGPKSFAPPVWPALALPTAAAASVPVVSVSAAQVFLSFLKIGSVLFGSGYVLIAYLEGEFIDRLGWLTRSQLLDAVAIGQFTPGPVLSTSTFIGYQMQGVTGAILATLGIFLPSFVFVAILNPYIPKLRKSPWASCFLDAVNVSVVGIMAAVVVEWTAGAVTDWRSGLIAALSIAVVLIARQTNVVWIVLGGALLGLLLT